MRYPKEKASVSWIHTREEFQVEHGLITIIITDARPGLLSIVNEDHARGIDYKPSHRPTGRSIDFSGNTDIHIHIYAFK